MKQVKVFFVLAVAMALIISIAAAMPTEEEKEEMVIGSSNHSLSGTDGEQEPSSSSTSGFSSLRGVGRFLSHTSNPRQQMTCNKYPRICRAKGSPGPDCCNKKCVNVSRDRLNCGSCGHKCKYNEICCGGKCVNPSSNKKHCGGCKIKCKKGSKCVLGMCSYA